MKIIVFFLLLALNGCVKFSLTEMCACDEFEKEYCTSLPYCSWNGSSCTDLECKYQSEEFCTHFLTQLKCKWNESSKICEDHTYKCSDLTKKLCFSSFYLGIDCMWQDDQCKPQDCSQDDNCNSLKCSAQKGQCGPKIDNLDCSSRTTEMCPISDGNGKACFLNDNQECKEYPLFSSSCSDYEDRLVFCNHVCYYDIKSKSCIPKECNQITQESLCQSSLIDFPSLQIFSCKWSDGSCKEIETEEIEKSNNALDCLSYGWLHYKWQQSTNECKQCKSFVKNPQYAIYEEFMYGIELFQLVSFSLLLLL